MQPPETFHGDVPGPEKEVVRVAENNRGAGLEDFRVPERLDSPVRAHRHEYRRLDAAVRRVHHAGTCRPVLGRQTECEHEELPLILVVTRETTARWRYLRRPVWRA